MTGRQFSFDFVCFAPERPFLTKFDFPFPYRNTASQSELVEVPLVIFTSELVPMAKR